VAITRDTGDTNRLARTANAATPTRKHNPRKFESLMDLPLHSIINGRETAEICITVRPI